ncbi:hypothetical protein [Chryseobacterium sp. MP_3.2]|uniref:hypothetical protein n=1 Tax=Chryseobacterium sp. MP_3.2 TaxID=3071712 RepID=UPI002E0B6CC8|nr:hypothetical protein [Chryseobacterium sp. MP_3.2]
MVKKIKNYMLLPLLAILVCSCTNTMQNNSSKSSDISSVSYSKTLGRAGFLKIVATKDSLISTKYGSAFNDNPEVKRKIDAADWNKIVSSINIEMIKKIKSGEGQGHYDGPDEIFEITTSDHKYTLMNVADSAQYKQLGNLKNVIKKITSSQK